MVDIVGSSIRLIQGFFFFITGERKFGTAAGSTPSQWSYDPEHAWYSRIIWNSSGQVRGDDCANSSRNWKSSA